VRDFIVSDPEIMGGTPCIKGTRITVYAVVARIEGGESMDILHEDWPYVPVEALTAAVDYVRAQVKRLEGEDK